MVPTFCCGTKKRGEYKELEKNLAGGKGTDEIRVNCSELMQLQTFVYVLARPYVGQYRDYNLCKEIKE